MEGSVLFFFSVRAKFQPEKYDFNLKNMISTYTKDLSWKKKKPKFSRF